MYDSYKTLCQLTIVMVTGVTNKWEIMNAVKVWMLQNHVITYAETII